MPMVDTDWGTLFCAVDDFCQAFVPQMNQQMLSAGVHQCQRKTALSESELITILIAFQTSRFRDFNVFYLFLMLRHRRELTGLVTYDRLTTCRYA